MFRIRARTGTDAAGEFRKAEPEMSACKWTAANDAAKIKDSRRIIGSFHDLTDLCLFLRGLM